MDFKAIPRTHNIRRLVNDFADKPSQKVPEETYALFDMLTRYYINNRYPDYIDDLLQQSTQSEATAVLAQTKEARNRYRVIAANT